MSDHSSRNQQYAQSLAEIARAEGCLDETADELFRFARALAGHDELRATLSDRRIPVSRRQQIAEDLLAGRARPVTTGIISLLVAGERASDIDDIAQELADYAAKSKQAEVAYVRSAVALTPEQVSRLEQALGQATGKTIEVKASVDANVLGGVVATIGDTVIDGSVRSRLAKLRDSFS